MIIMNGAHIITETLKKLNIDTVFGYPGGQVTDIYDALYDSGIKHILTSHEQGAGHGADGYARASGKAGVVIATSGPGVTNLVTALATAYADSVPLIAITGNVPLSSLGTDGFQEVDAVGVTMPVTKHSFIVKDVCDLSETLVKAYEIAMHGRRGPVLIDVPKDIQRAECEFTFRAPAFPKGNDSNVNEALKLIKSSKRPLIFCGGGVTASSAESEVAELSEILDAPVAVSMMGLSSYPSDSERYLGMMGLHGQYFASEAALEADLIIALGVRFSDRSLGSRGRVGKDTKILHIDIDPAEINKNVEAYTGVEGDIKEVLMKILPRLAEKKRAPWMRRIAELKSEPQRKSYPKDIINAVRNLAEDNTPIVTDVGQHQMWVTQSYKFKAPRTFISSCGMGTMGFGMGASIGSALATGRKTVLFTGDGSFLMNLSELATAVMYNIPLVVIVMNNGTLGMVRQWQTLLYDKRYSNTTLSGKSDFAKIAEGFGAKGYSITDKSQLKSVLREAFSENGPAVVDCRIDINEEVYPVNLPINGD